MASPSLCTPSSFLTSPFSSRLSDHFFLPPALSSRLPDLLCLLGPKTIGFGANQDSRIIDCMGFVDRHSTFYSFFIVWLTGTMDSIKSAKLLSKTIETIKNHKKIIECAVPVNKNHKINDPGILVGPKSYGLGTEEAEKVGGGGRTRREGGRRRGRGGEGGWWGRSTTKGNLEDAGAFIAYFFNISRIPCNQSQMS